MKKSNIEVKSARVQMFRLRRSDEVYGILPEITFCLDRFGVSRGQNAKVFKLFGEQVCDNNFLVNILEMFNVHYPHEVSGRFVHVVFVDGKPVGISPSNGDCFQQWIVWAENSYQRITYIELFKKLLPS